MSDLVVPRYRPTWATHIPALLSVLKRTTGPILELGVGIYSTPLLHAVAEDQGRELHSYEDNLEWFHAHLPFRSKRHWVHLVKDWEDVPVEMGFPVVFIDHTESRRVKDSIRAKNSDYVIIHDSEKYDYSSVFPYFNYHYEYTKLKPYTLILSNAGPY